MLIDLGHIKTQLEATSFDVQFFISEHAQDLSPTQSRQLLNLLNTTQKGILDAQGSVAAQVERLEAQLQLEQELDHQKVCLSLRAGNSPSLVLQGEACNVDARGCGEEELGKFF